MKNKILPYIAFATIFAIIGFILDQVIMYLTLSEKFIPSLPIVATFFSGITPGLFLGIAISLAFKRTHKNLKPKRYYMFILTASISSLLVYVLPDLFFDFVIHHPYEGHFLSIMVETFLFVYGFHSYIFHLSPKQILSLTFIGAIAFYPPFMLGLINAPYSFLSLLLYPIITATAIGWLVHKKSTH